LSPRASVKYARFNANLLGCKKDGPIGGGEKTFTTLFLREIRGNKRGGVRKPEEGNDQTVMGAPEQGKWWGKKIPSPLRRLRGNVSPL